jgi:hypothetical protein
MIQTIRPDYIFSYWIFAWYLLYITGWVTPNPKFAIYIAIFENLIIFLSMIYLKTNLKKVIYFLIMVILIKLIPLWTLRNTKIKEKDIYATLGVVLMYVGWIIWDDKMISLSDAYTHMVDDKIRSPGMSLLSKLFG